jgi:hypothetical protein
LGPTVGRDPREPTPEPLQARPGRAGAQAPLEKTDPGLELGQRATHLEDDVAWRPLQEAHVGVAHQAPEVHQNVENERHARLMLHLREASAL